MPLETGAASPEATSDALPAEIEDSLSSTLCDEDETRSQVMGVLESGDTESYEVERSLPEEGKRLVESYGQRRDCVPTWSGYLDLFGNAWGMVVRGPRWVDICIIQEHEGDAMSKVTIIHMDADEWEASLGSG